MWDVQKKRMCGHKAGQVECPSQGKNGKPIIIRLFKERQKGEKARERQVPLFNIFDKGGGGVRGTYKSGSGLRKSKRTGKKNKQ